MSIRVDPRVEFNDRMRARSGWWPLLSAGLARVDETYHKELEIIDRRFIADIEAWDRMLERSRARRERLTALARTQFFTILVRRIRREDRAFAAAQRRHPEVTAPAHRPPKPSSRGQTVLTTVKPKPVGRPATIYTAEFVNELVARIDARLAAHRPSRERHFRDKLSVPEALRLDCFELWREDHLAAGHSRAVAERLARAKTQDLAPRLEQHRQKYYLAKRTARRRAR